MAPSEDIDGVGFAVTSNDVQALFVDPAGEEVLTELSGRLIGAEAVAPEAGELIQTATIAIRARTVSPLQSRRRNRDGRDSDRRPLEFTL